MNPENDFKIDVLEKLNAVFYNIDSVLKSYGDIDSGTLKLAILNWREDIINLMKICRTSEFEPGIDLSVELTNLICAANELNDKTWTHRRGEAIQKAITSLIGEMDYALENFQDAAPFRTATDDWKYKMSLLLLRFNELEEDKP